MAGEKVSDEQIEKELNAIRSNTFQGEEEVKLGENRGQLFVRIPRSIRNELDLNKNYKVVFKVKHSKGKKSLEIELRK